MNPADASRVFDRFWRADPSRRRTIGGTGLGLAISLEDAALHGGRLEVWSEPGSGSRFVVTLPRVAGGRIEGAPLPVVPPDRRGETTVPVTGEPWSGSVPVAETPGVPIPSPSSGGADDD